MSKLLQEVLVLILVISGRTGKELFLNIGSTKSIKILLVDYVMLEIDWISYQHEMLTHLGAIPRYKFFSCEQRHPNSMDETKLGLANF